MWAESSWVLVVIAFWIGALHTLAPDHWVPLSLLSWQRGWGSRKTRWSALQLFGSHVLMGLLFALLLAEWTHGLNERELMQGSLMLVGGVTLLRLFRFSRLQEAFASGPLSKRGLLAAWSLLGPAESLIPVVLRSNQLGSGYLAPSIAYATGTLLAGIGLVFWGRSLWNRPWALRRSWIWLRRTAPVLPVLAFLLTGLTVGAGVLR